MEQHASWQLKNSHARVSPTCMHMIGLTPKKIGVMFKRWRSSACYTSAGMHGRPPVWQAETCMWLTYQPLQDRFLIYLLQFITRILGWRLRHIQRSPEYDSSACQSDQVSQSRQVHLQLYCIRGNIIMKLLSCDACQHYASKCAEELLVNCC